MNLCITYQWWLKPYLAACTLAAWLIAYDPVVRNGGGYFPNGRIRFKPSK